LLIVLIVISYNQPQQMNTSYSSNGNMYGQQNYQQPYMQETTYTSMSPVTTGYKGKKAPMQPEDPII